LRVQNMTGRTVETYLSDIALLFAHIPPENIPTVNGEKLGEAIRAVSAVKNNDVAVRRWLSVAGRFFDYCVKAGIRDDNPVFFYVKRSDPGCSAEKCARKLLAMPRKDTPRAWRDAAVIAVTSYTYFKFTEGNTGASCSPSHLRGALTSHTAGTQ